MNNKIIYFLFFCLGIVILTNLEVAYAADNIRNKEERKFVYTTEQALSYTFGGISNQVVVDDVLARLNKLGIKGTFFVAEIEMKRYPQNLRKIIQNGHEIGIAIRPNEHSTAKEVEAIIRRSKNLLENQFGVTTNLVKQPWGVVAMATKDAVSATESYLIGQSLNIVQSKHKEYSSADAVMREIFKKSMISLARGQIIHFRMDYYTNNQLVGDLLEKIKQEKIDNIAYEKSFDNTLSNPRNDSSYTINPVGQILNNSKFNYQYPVDLTKVPEQLRNIKNDINIEKHEFIGEVAKRYIGNGQIDYDDRILGFSKMDIRRLDKSGLIHTEDNVIFLTFDDWGTDAAINKLLYVFRKHNVSGTFFVLTNNVLNNPNLLRAIAVEGHDIANHTDKHKPMVVIDSKTGKKTSPQTKEEYTAELALSYQKLRDVTGDVVVTGKPALTRLFRPPTLAISRQGFEALLGTSYEYIVCGSTSTEDYKAESVADLLEIIKSGIYTKDGKVKKGANLVFHMSDASKNTAVALDILLTANAAKDDADPSKFKVGRLSDYLTNDYSQNSRLN